MFTYFIHRVLVMVPTFFAISVLVFIIIQRPPGDYLTILIGGIENDPNAAAKIEFLRKEYGLDKPLIEQYALIPQDIADTRTSGLGQVRKSGATTQNVRSWG